MDTLEEVEEELTLAEELAEDSHLDAEVFQAYADNMGEDCTTVEAVEECYQGEWNSDEEFVQDLLEQIGDIPDNLPHYIHIDWESTARDIMYDYFEVDGHYFRSI